MNNITLQSRLFHISNALNDPTQEVSSTLGIVNYDFEVVRKNYSEGFVKEFAATLMAQIAANQKTAFDRFENNNLVIYTYAKSILESIRKRTSELYHTVINNAENDLDKLLLPHLPKKLEGECKNYQEIDEKLRAIFKRTALHHPSSGEEELEAEYEIDYSTAEVEQLLESTKDENARYEIAKTLLTHYGFLTKETLSMLNLSDEGHRLELARLHAEYSTQHEVLPIKAYRITKESDRLALIRKVQQRATGMNVSILLHDYGIEDSKQLLELIGVELKQGRGMQVIENLRHYNLTPKQRYEIIWEAYTINADYLRPLKNYTWQELSTLFSPCRPLLCLAAPKKAREYVDLIMKSGGDTGDYFTKLFEQTLKEAANDQVLEETIRWLGFFDFLHREVPAEKIAITMPFIRQIAELHSPVMREGLTMDLYPFYKSEPQLKIFKELENQFPQKQEHTQIFRFLLTPLIHDSEVSSSSIANIAKFLNHSVFKDSRYRNIAITALMSLSNDEGLSSKQKMALLQKICTKSINTAQDKTEVFNYLRAVPTMVQIGRSDRLLTLETSKQIERYLLDKFMDDLGIEEEQRKTFEERFNATFGAMQNPGGIFIYAEKLRTLSVEEGREEVWDSLTEFVTGVLVDKFTDYRYDATTSDHLTALFQDETLAEKWKKGAKLTVKELDKYFARSTAPPNVHHSLFKAVCEEGTLEKENFPSLWACLGDPSKKSAITTTLISECAQLAKQGKKEDLKKRKFELAVLNLLDITQDAKSEAETKDKDESKPKLSIQAIRSRISALDLFDDIYKNHEPFKQFKESLCNAILTYYDPPAARWTVEDTDEWSDLILLGEFAQSCQKLDGDPNITKCLLGYLMDGKNRVIFLKDDKMNNMGRVVIRLLWDRDTHSPVLFQEESYFMENIPLKAKEAVQKMILLRAQLLKIPLVARKCVAQEHAVSTLKPFSHLLQSLGSRTPFEYVDALAEEMGGAGITPGKYDIASGEKADRHLVLVEPPKQLGDVASIY